MLIGYARVSTTEQNLDLQIDALQKAGCELLFHDTISGAKAERPGLKDALSHLRRDDTLVVWKLDRLGRTTKGLIDLAESLKERGIGFKSLQDNIDTGTPMGQFFFVLMSAIVPTQEGEAQASPSKGVVPRFRFRRPRALLPCEIADPLL